MMEKKKKEERNKQHTLSNSKSGLVFTTGQYPEVTVMNAEVEATYNARTVSPVMTFIMMVEIRAANAPRNLERKTRGNSLYNCLNIYIYIYHCKIVGPCLIHYLLLFFF